MSTPEDEIRAQGEEIFRLVEAGKLLGSASQSFFKRIAYRQHTINGLPMLHIFCGEGFAPSR